MIGKIAKMAFWGTVGISTGLVGIGLMGALDEADYPLE